MNLLVKFAAGFAGLYVLVVALIALAQDWLLFPRRAMGDETTNDLFGFLTTTPNAVVAPVNGRTKRQRLPFRVPDAQS